MTEPSDQEIRWLAALAARTSAEAELADPLGTARAALGWAWTTVGNVTPAELPDPIGAGLYWMELAEAIAQVAGDLDQVDAAPAGATLHSAPPGPHLPETPSLRAGVYRALIAARGALTARTENAPSGRARLRAALAARAAGRAAERTAAG